MLRTAKPLLHNGQYDRQLTPHQCYRIESQTCKDLTPQQSVGIHGHALVLPGAQHEPIDGLV